MESKSHECDVFINHRGPDVKKTFVAHLDAALRRDGFRPFLDAKDIGQGRHVFNTIDKALKGACVHVAIFSKRYAESKYCLNELCSMLSSGKDILPVFYHVKPEDLRWIENGPFKVGFGKHMERNRGDLIPKWKKALLEIADYRGFRLDEVNGNEEQLIRSILVEVRRLMPIDVLPGMQHYGTAESMTNVLKLLENTNVVGLVGMGGIGKTTLAEEVFNHFVMCRQFERYCLLKDVRSKSSEPVQLQQEFLRELGHDAELQSRSAQEYARAFNGVMRQRVLIIVDDIDHYEQFAAIIPDIRRLGSSSRVVITSRQRDVLVQAMASAASCEVYEVPLLNKAYSRHLFNRHAFLSETPSEGFVELAGQVADACGGHALLLKTIGASLFDKKRAEDEGIWKETMQALEENEEVFDKLRSTYDSLPAEGDKAMFREIACMLIGMEQDVALRIWKSCNSGMHSCTTSRSPESALRRLVDRSLVKVESGRFGMHDVLRDMGRDIVKKEGRKPEEWSYLWDGSVAKKVLSYNKMNTTIRGMVLGSLKEMAYDYVNFRWARMEHFFWRSMKDSGVSCEMSQLASMEELHFLVLNNCDVTVLDGSSSWPQELRWLQWRGCCFSKLPSHLNLPSLVVLDLSHSYELTRLWKDDALIQLPVLEALDLSRCWRLGELPENVGQSVPRLKKLKMGYCTNLWRLPASIGHLVDLEHLDLEGCDELVNLPEEIMGLISLKELYLINCRKLQQLPVELGKLTTLKTLNLFRCGEFCELPASIGGLKMLETLCMTYSEVTNLPVGFGLLTSLTTLKLPSTVQGTLEGLQALTSLSVWRGSIDVTNFGALSALKYLDLCGHVTVTILPKSLGNLKWLVDLRMSRCPLLATIEALPIGLEHLDLSDCPKLTTIPSLVCLTALKFIDISGCTSIAGRGIRIIESRALCRCNLSGSKVGVLYNSRWLERDPAIQVIRYRGDTLPVFSNGMASPIVLGNGRVKVLEASISSKAEFVALIWCVVVRDIAEYCYNLGTKVEVWRSGRLVTEVCLLRSEEGLGYVNIYYNQVCMYTMRREHHIVQSLQHGDKIFIYMGHEFVIGRVVEGGVCTVHKEDGNLVMAMNSEVLSRNRSEQLESQFAQLVLEDKMNLKLELWSGSPPNHGPQNRHKTQLVLEDYDQQLAIPEMNFELEVEDQDEQLEILELNFEFEAEDVDQQLEIPEMNLELQLWSRSPPYHVPRKRLKTQLVVEDDDQELQVSEIDLELKL